MYREEALPPQNHKPERASTSAAEASLSNAGRKLFQEVHSTQAVDSIPQRASADKGKTAEDTVNKHFGNVEIANAEQAHTKHPVAPQTEVAARGNAANNKVEAANNSPSPTQELLTKSNTERTPGGSIGASPRTTEAAQRTKEAPPRANEAPPKIVSAAIDANTNQANQSARSNAELAQQADQAIITAKKEERNKREFEQQQQAPRAVQGTVIAKTEEKTEAPGQAKPLTPASPSTLSKSTVNGEATAVQPAASESNKVHANDEKVTTFADPIQKRNNQLEAVYSVKNPDAKLTPTTTGVTGRIDAPSLKRTDDGRIELPRLESAHREGGPKEVANAELAGSEPNRKDLSRNDHNEVLHNDRNGLVGRAMNERDQTHEVPGTKQSANHEQGWRETRVITERQPASQMASCESKTKSDGNSGVPMFMPSDLIGLRSLNTRINTPDRVGRSEADKTTTDTKSPEQKSEQKASIKEDQKAETKIRRCLVDVIEQWQCGKLPPNGAATRHQLLDELKKIEPKRLEEIKDLILNPNGSKAIKAMTSGDNILTTAERIVKALAADLNVALTIKFVAATRTDTKPEPISSKLNIVANSKRATGPESNSESKAESKPSSNSDSSTTKDNAPKLDVNLSAILTDKNVVRVLVNLITEWQTGKLLPNGDTTRRQALETMRELGPLKAQQLKQELIASKSDKVPSFKDSDATTMASFRKVLKALLMDEKAIRLAAPATRVAEAAKVERDNRATGRQVVVVVEQPELEQRLPMLACPKCAMKCQLGAVICPICKADMPAGDLQDARNAAIKSETEPQTAAMQREQIYVRPPLAGSFRQTAQGNRQSA